MKKLLLITCAVAFLPFSMRAQDDMYFIPKKKAKTVATPATTPTAAERPPYYRGLDMSVDEYNRRGIRSSYQAISDSVGNDIIDFSMGDGTYPDSIAIDSIAVPEEVEEFRYSNQLGRFDDFYGWYDPWIFPYYWNRYGYYTPYWGTWGVYDPFFYDWYGPFGYYSSWYYPYGYYGYGWGPWYYSYYYTYPYYYRPYYYSWGGGGHIGSGGYAARVNNSSSRPVQNYSRGYTSVPNGRFGGRTISSTAERRGTFGNGGSVGARTAAPGTRASSVGGVSRGSTSAGGRGSVARSSVAGSRSSAMQSTRSSSSSSSPSRSTYTPSRSFSTPSSSGGSFSSGGSRSSGGSFSGGGRSGGSFSGGGRGRR